MVDHCKEFYIHSMLTLLLNKKLQKSGEEHKWNMTKNRMLRRIFGLQREGEK
jgi:hypothetical protein